MTWTYRQTDGELLHDGEFIGTGYSGTKEGRNNPAEQATPNVGPVPQGTFTIGPSHSELVLGPCVMNLDPVEGTNTFGRSLFRIHGDNARHDASHGCVILGPAIRQQISDSPDKILVVTT